VSAGHGDKTRRLMTRRQFIQRTALGAAGVVLLRDAARSADGPALARRQPPNLLFMNADQQHFQAMSGLGCEHVHTPNMDRLLARGVAFSQSYSANPVCCPARACWYTGRPASENGMLSNAHQLAEGIPDLGQWFRDRGYEPFYSGKWHVPGRDPHASFTCLTANPSGQGEHCDPVVSRSAQAFLRNYRGDKPFFLSLGFLQPHDCCYWVFAHRDDIGALPYPAIKDDLPPLPGNFECDLEEPPTLLKHLTNIRRANGNWSPLHWRYYLWSYYRHVEMVDAEIGRVLDALEDSRFARDTLIILTADHGDGLARRKLVSKWFPYDEAARVPLVVCPPGAEDGGAIDRSHVVSGLDIAPTLCDFAGIEPPPSVRGRSLRPLVEGRHAEWREFVVSESNITGRLVRTPEWKLITYAGETPDLLFDMRQDPWEKQNLAGEPQHADTVADLKARLGDWEKRLEPAEQSRASLRDHELGFLQPAGA
jgi:arylsulfatase A-like enzyme